jgi:hypothetical protein
MQSEVVSCISSLFVIQVIREWWTDDPFVLDRTPDVVRISTTAHSQLLLSS